MKTNLLQQVRQQGTWLFNSKKEKGVKFYKVAIILNSYTPGSTLHPLWFSRMEDPVTKVTEYSIVIWKDNHVYKEIKSDSYRDLKVKYKNLVEGITNLINNL